MSEHSPHFIPDGRVELNGKSYMQDAKGSFVPVELNAPAVLLEDGEVRKIMGYALALSEQVARFKAHTFEDLGALRGAAGAGIRPNQGWCEGQQDLHVA
jgi:hypothetical protein